MPKPLDENKEGEAEEPEMIVIKEDKIKKEYASTIPSSTQR